MTQDARLQQALVVEDKAQRAYNFHKNTVQGLAEITAACGLDQPNEFCPRHLCNPHRPNVRGKEAQFRRAALLGAGLLRVDCGPG